MECFTQIFIATPLQQSKYLIINKLRYPVAMGKRAATLIATT
jgi:hypothetical protein